MQSFATVIAYVHAKERQGKHFYSKLVLQLKQINIQIYVDIFTNQFGHRLRLFSFTIFLRSCNYTHLFAFLK